ncbi:MAG: tyrosine-type recombinase/integrase, partial [Clostridium sp.]|nr:tyrosine-type recombinase/integrase [Clostridium sp.]
LPNITAHILRHTACTRMAEAGMDQRTLQEIMGHSNLAITMKVYNHVDDKRMREEIEKFDEKRDGKEKVS